MNVVRSALSGLLLGFAVTSIVSVSADDDCFDGCDKSDGWYFKWTGPGEEGEEACYYYWQEQAMHPSYSRVVMPVSNELDAPGENIFKFKCAGIDCTLRCEWVIEGMFIQSLGSYTQDCQQTPMVPKQRCKDI